MAIRRSIESMTLVEVEELRDAFRNVMALNDERGYQFYAGLHGLPLPFLCEHGTLLFLPWHRAYLLFFEFALQDQSNPDVGIPWWDWTSDHSHLNGIPDAYKVEPVSGPSNPLVRSDVVLPPDQLDLVRQFIPDAIDDTGLVPTTIRDVDLPDELPRRATIDDILEAPTFADFSTRLENVHGAVHVWVGGSMAQVPLAGFDPIFFSHHTMIDRLWYLWQMRNPGINPQAELLDVVLTPFNVTVAQMLDINALGYDYAVQVIQ